jgi:hypothetical protein
VKHRVAGPSAYGCVRERKTATQGTGPSWHVPVSVRLATAPVASWSSVSLRLQAVPGGPHQIEPLTWTLPIERRVASSSTKTSAMPWINS